jgi:hypothetical protein
MQANAPAPVNWPGPGDGVQGCDASDNAGMYRRRKFSLLVSLSFWLYLSSIIEFIARSHGLDYYVSQISWLQYLCGGTHSAPAVAAAGEGRAVAVGDVREAPVVERRVELGVAQLVSHLTDGVGRLPSARGALVGETAVVAVVDCVLIAPIDGHVEGTPSSPHVAQKPAVGVWAFYGRWRRVECCGCAVQASRTVVYV